MTADIRRTCLHSISDPRKYACGVGLRTTKGDGEKAINEMGEKVKVENVPWFSHQDVIGGLDEVVCYSVYSGSECI